MLGTNQAGEAERFAEEAGCTPVPARGKSTQGMAPSHMAATGKRGSEWAVMMCGCVEVWSVTRSCLQPLATALSDQGRKVTSWHLKINRNGATALHQWRHALSSGTESSSQYWGTPFLMHFYVFSLNKIKLPEGTIFWLLIFLSQNLRESIHFLSWDK